MKTYQVIIIRKNEDPSVFSWSKESFVNGLIDLYHDALYCLRPEKDGDTHELNEDLFIQITKN